MQMADTSPSFGTLTDYDARQAIRPATERERLDSVTASIADGGEGVIEVGGVACFVEGRSTCHLPDAITVEGVDFHKGTKLGTDRLTGLLSVEYVDAGDRRCWVRTDGVVGEVE